MFHRSSKYNEKVCDDANVSTWSQNVLIRPYVRDQIVIKQIFEKHFKAVKVIRKLLIYNCT